MRMNHCIQRLKRSGHLRRSLSSALVLVVLLSFLLNVDPPLLRSWGSWWVQASLLSSTHQALCAYAYKQLKKHPALTHGIKFPSLEEILRYSWVRMDYSGDGPDNYHKCAYSNHVYNPELPEHLAGGAPKAIAAQFEKLKVALSGTISSDKNSLLPAKNAAWLAHFAQDLSCPYHVMGMPADSLKSGHPSLLNTKTVGLSRPAQDLSILIERFKEDIKVFGQNADWFDPWYYNGNDRNPVKSSSHFHFEALVSAASLGKDTGYNKEWMSCRSAEEYAISIARRTRGYVNRADSGVFDPFSPTAGELLNSAVKDTYTIWRAAFCALRLVDVVLEKVPNQDFAFRLKMKVMNSEPEDDALSVNASYAFKESSINGSGDFKRIGHISRFNSEKTDRCTAETLSNNVIRLDKDFFDNLATRSGWIAITIKGKYYDVPDAGLMVEYIPLAEIEHKMIKLMDMTNPPLGIEDAKSYLASFDVDMERSSEPPPELRLENTVISQFPNPGTWVGPGDKVKITHYGEFEEVRVPPVINKTVYQARELIEITFPPKHVKPVLKAVTIPKDAKPTDIVIKQTPEAGKLVPLGSDILIHVRVIEESEESTERIEEKIEESEKLDEPEPVETEATEESADENPIQVAFLVIEPAAPELVVGYSNAVALTARAYDMDKNEIVGEALSRINFEWSVLDSSLAYITGSGQTAFVSILDSVKVDLLENPEKTLQVEAFCTTRTANDTAVIIIRMADLKEDWGKISERKEETEEEDWAKISERKEKSRIAKNSSKKKYVYRTTGVVGTWTDKYYGSVVRVIKKGNVYTGYLVKNNFRYEFHPYDPMEKIWILSEAGKDDVGNNRYIGVAKRKYKHWRGHMVNEWHKCEFVTVVQPGVDCLRVSSDDSDLRWTGLEFLRKNHWIPEWMKKNK